MKFADDNGYLAPSRRPITVLAVDGDQVLLADGMTWHYSHFEKVGENPAKTEAKAIEAGLEEDEEQADGDFNEFSTLGELTAYIAQTYTEHYAKRGVQTFALIAKDPVRGINFALGNAMKYSDRYGEKGGRNRKDLLKAAHYLVLALYCDSQLQKGTE